MQKNEEIKRIIAKDFKHMTLSSNNFRKLCVFVNESFERSTFDILTVSAYLSHYNFENLFFKFIIERIMKIIEDNLKILESGQNHFQKRNGWIFNSIELIDGFRFYYPIPKFRKGEVINVGNEIRKFKESLSEQIFNICEKQGGCTVSELKLFYEEFTSIRVSGTTQLTRLRKYMNNKKKNN